MKWNKKIEHLLTHLHQKKDYTIIVQQNKSWQL